MPSVLHAVIVKAVPLCSVFEAQNITVTYEGQDIIKDFAPTVMRGDRIGIVGPNGAGKTTLIKVLMDLIKPTHGYVRIGTNVQIQYFDQYHEQLFLDKSVADNVIMWLKVRAMSPLTVRLCTCSLI